MTNNLHFTKNVRIFVKRFEICWNFYDFSIFINHKFLKIMGIVWF